MAGVRTMLKHLLLAALAMVAVVGQPQQPQQLSGQDCKGSTDVCRASSERFCCNKIGGGSQTYDTRVFRAGTALNPNRYCVNPASFFDCASTRCIPKGGTC